jgi:hypothetical protein
MRRLAVLASLACALSFTACDDDDEPRSRDGGKDTASDSKTDSAGAVMCTGSFASATRAQLGALTPPSAKCGSSSDLDLICTGDLAAKVRTAGMTCLGNNAGNNAAVIQCVVQSLTSQGLSMTCAGCYSESVACTLQKCLAQCGTNPNAPDCIACQTVGGCISAFATCSGLPLPGGSTDGGTVDSGAGDGGKDGATDGTTDTTPSDAADAGADTTSSDAGADAAADASADTAADVGSDV